MISFAVVVLFAAGVCSARVTLRPSGLREDTLVLSNIVFRHGGRTPDQDSLWPTNPFYNESYYQPYGYAQLTNDGKRTEYKIGLALRKRYNKFLGQTWNINTLEARSTDYNRTKMSLQLVLAGLYPPDRKLNWWPGLNWQPIPTNYQSNDRELQGVFGFCPKYFAEFMETLSSGKFAEINSEYKWVYDLFYENTGIQISNVYNIYMYYFGLLVQEQLGLPLEKWTKAIYPEPMKTLAVDMYYAMTNSTSLRKVATGYLLKKIIADARSKIGGTLSPNGRKFYLYSAHEYNVANTLSALDLFDGEVPNYGSYVLIELHNVKGVYGIQILHQNYKTKEPKLLTLPGCTSFCPFERFVALTEKIIPDDDDC